MLEGKHSIQGDLVICCELTIRQAAQFCMVQAGSSDIFARHVTRSLYEHGEKPSRTDSSRPDKVSLPDQKIHVSSSGSGLPFYSGLHL